MARLAGSSTEATRALADEGQTAATRLEGTGRTIREAWTLASQSLIDRLEAVRGVLDTALGDRGEALVGGLNEAADRLHETVVVRGQALEDVLGTVTRHSRRGSRAHRGRPRGLRRRAHPTIEEFERAEPS